MRLSSLADYAVVMMSACARHCGHAKVNATTLAAETRIPLPTAQKLVSKLSAAGLLESTRGVGGGVRLSRPPAAISLAEIIEAVEGPIEMTSCVDSGRHECQLESCCQVRPHMSVVNGAVRGALARVSLSSLGASNSREAQSSFLRASASPREQKESGSRGDAETRREVLAAARPEVAR